MTGFVLATANEDKAREVAEILGPGFNLLPRPADVPEVEETGTTLVENARIKAVALVRATGQAAIADDTGLEVEALGGAPGVFSSRYSGAHATYEDNVRKLLQELDGVPEPRLALFRTVAIAVWANGDERVAEGRVEGQIVLFPRGDGGFGYDPVFEPAGTGRTFAEMTPQEKHRVSHRGRAFRALAELLGR